MKSFFFRLLFLGLLVSSCAESSTIGESLFGEEDFQVSYIDTVTFSIGTLKFDSVATSEQDRLLVGEFSSDLLGDIRSETYFLLSYLATGTSEIDELTVFDSATFVIPQDGYVYKMEEDQMTVTLNIEQLNTEFDYFSDGQLYNRSKVVSDTESLTLLSSSSISLVKDRVREYEIRVSDDFAEPLFTNILEGNDEVSSQNDFEKYLNGFRLSMASEDDTPIVGLKKDSIRFKLYYTDTDNVPPTAETAEFYIGDSPNYTHIINNNISEGLSEIESVDDIIPSQSTEHVSVTAGTLGYVMKVGFPYIQNLLLDGKDYLIVSSELKLVPNLSYMDEDNLPSRLQVNYRNSADELITEETFYAILVLDDDFGRDTYYSLDVSDLIEVHLTPFSNEDYFITISLEGGDFGSSLTTVALESGALRSELVLYTVAGK